jgi:hypothetical protein
VIGIVIGHVDLQHVQALVNGFGQAEFLDQQVDRADAATGNGADPFGHVVMNVARPELGRERQGIFAFVEPTGNSALAFVEPAADNILHLKSFRDQGA